MIINAGTVCSVPNQPLLQFVTTESATLAAGELSTTASAESVDVGRRFNLPEGAVTVMVNAPVSIAGVVNSTAFNGGYDGESDNAYRRRIIDMFKIPLVITSKRETENRIRQINEVIDCSLTKSEEYPARVKVILRTTLSNFTTKLRNDIAKNIGINTFVDSSVELAMAKEKEISLSVSVKIKPSSDSKEIEQKIEEIITAYFSSERIGENVYLSPVLKKIYAIDEVERVDFNCSEIKNDLIRCESDSYIHLKNVAVICYE